MRQLFALHLGERTTVRESLRTFQQSGNCKSTLAKKIRVPKTEESPEKTRSGQMWLQEVSDGKYKLLC